LFNQNTKDNRKVTKILAGYSPNFKSLKMLSNEKYIFPLINNLDAEKWLGIVRNTMPPTTFLL